MLVVIRVNMMKLKAKYHGSCKSNSNARSYTRKYDEAQSPSIMLVVIMRSYTRKYDAQAKVQL